MTVGLLANENLPDPAIRKLRAAGVDVVAVAEEMVGATDAEVLARARREERWIVTFDRDYGELVFKKRMPPPPSILYLRQEPYPPDRPADLVLAVLSKPVLAEGFLVVLGKGRMRRRSLPLSNVR